MAEIRQLNWANIGLTIVGIEFGFLLSYRAGRHLGIAAVFVNVASLILVPVAVFFFRDKISWVNILGILVCLVGLVMLNGKRKLGVEMKNPRSRTVIPILVLMILVLAGCSSDNKTMQQLSEHYKEHQDYESLVALVPYLDYTFTRSDVEDLLGEPVYCPSAANCYYTTDKSVVVFCRDAGGSPCKGSPLTLTIGYALAEKNVVSPQDNLAGFAIAPIGD